VARGSVEPHVGVSLLLSPPLLLLLLLPLLLLVVLHRRQYWLVVLVPGPGGCVCFGGNGFLTIRGGLRTVHFDLRRIFVQLGQIQKLKGPRSKHHFILTQEWQFATARDIVSKPSLAVLYGAKCKSDAQWRIKKKRVKKGVLSSLLEKVQNPQ
jgi:hypothetical protein